MGIRLNRAIGSRCLIRAMLKIKHQSSITDFSVAICLLSFISFQRKIAILSFLSLQRQVAILNLLTGKSLSEELILASTNPQYDKRLFIELQVQYMKTKYKLRTCCVHKLFFVFVLTFRTIYVQNMF